VTVRPSPNSHPTSFSAPGGARWPGRGASAADWTLADRTVTPPGRARVGSGAGGLTSGAGAGAGAGCGTCRPRRTYGRREYS
jgi:hypothetical protein